MWRALFRSTTVCIRLDHFFRLRTFLGFSCCSWAPHADARQAAQKLRRSAATAEEFQQSGGSEDFLDRADDHRSQSPRQQAGQARSRLLRQRKQKAGPGKAEEREGGRNTFQTQQGKRQESLLERDRRAERGPDGAAESDETSWCCGPSAENKGDKKSEETEENEKGKSKNAVEQKAELQEEEKKEKDELHEVEQIKRPRRRLAPEPATSLAPGQAAASSDSLAPSSGRRGSTGGTKIFSTPVEPRLPEEGATTQTPQRQNILAHQNTAQQMGSSGSSSPSAQQPAAQVPAPIVAQGQSQADAAAGASATVPSTPKPLLTDQDRKDGRHGCGGPVDPESSTWKHIKEHKKELLSWASNLNANTTIDAVATGAEDLLQKIVKPEQYQYLCNYKDFECPCTCSDDQKLQFDDRGRGCLDKYLRKLLKLWILREGQGGCGQPCAKVTGGNYHNYLPWLLESRDNLLEYSKGQDPGAIDSGDYDKRRAPLPAPGWKTWGDMQGQICQPKITTSAKANLLNTGVEDICEANYGVGAFANICICSTPQSKSTNAVEPKAELQEEQKTEGERQEVEQIKHTTSLTSTTSTTSTSSSTEEMVEVEEVSPRSRQPAPEPAPLSNAAAGTTTPSAQQPVAQVPPAPVLAQGQSQADAAGGASATVPSTPKPPLLTDQDRKAAFHWAENLAADTTIETMAANLENLVEKFTIPEEYQHLCAVSAANRNRMKLICGSSACEKWPSSATYKYDPGCLEKWLRAVFRDQILSQGLGKAHSRCVPVPTRDEWDHFPDFALPDFVKGKKSKSKKGLLQYLEKADGTGAGPWRTWGDMRNQLCGNPHGAFDCVPSGEHSPDPGTGEGYDWEPLPEKEYLCYEHEFGYDPHAVKFKEAASHWTKNLAASTTIETMAAKMENLVEAFTLPEQYQLACKDNVRTLSMELICGPSACEKPKGKPDADYKYDAACLEKWLRMELRDQILAQGLGKTNSRCVPVPTRDDWDHFPDFALPDFVKGKSELLRYRDKKDGTGAGPWRTWGDMRNQLCGDPHDAFDCVPLGEDSPNPGTGEGYDWEPLEKEHRCYRQEFGYDPHVYLR